MSRFNKINIEHFANLVQDIPVKRYPQEEFKKVVEELYMSIFRHNTSGDFVVETLPNEKGNWKVHKPSATKEEVMELIKKGQVIWDKNVI